MEQKQIVQGARILIYMLIGLLALISSLIESRFVDWETIKIFYAIATAGILLHLPPVLYLDKYFQSPRWMITTFLLDLVFVTSLMMKSQLSPSLFLFLYLINILLVGLIFRSRGALFAAIVSSIFFTFASWFSVEIKSFSYLFILIFNNVAFFAVAALSSYTSEQMNLFERKIQVQNLSLQMIRRLNEMMVEAMPVGLLTVDISGNILRHNFACSQILYPDLRSYFSGQKKQLDDKYSSADVSSLQGKNIKKILDLPINFANVKAKITQDYVHFLAANPHDTRDELLRVQIIPQQSEEIAETYLVIIEDLTELKRLEFTARQAEKMAAVGQLAAGIAHEIRNPLAGISGSIELLSQNFTTDDDKKLVKIIMREIDRLNMLITEFLDYSRPESNPSQIVSLGPILKEVLQNAVTKPLQLNLNVSDQAFIAADANKLRQAFLNIIINAVQAMDNCEKRILNVQAQPVGDKVQVVIKDTGCGMSESTRQRMFEPFHTTKAKGTGLGLAVTHKILQAHGATIDIDSKQGLGTEFKITFPLKVVENQTVASENNKKEVG